jgi:hypothetical protein
MYELTKPEVYKAIAYAKSIDEDAGRKIIERFEIDQTALAQTIFGIFPTVIAEQDQDMAHLFMDLCFDVLCVFEKSFDPLPPQTDMDIDWLAKQAVLLDTELKSLAPEVPMDKKIRKNLQDRFVKRAVEDRPQTELNDYMNLAIDDFASESVGRVPAIRITQTMIFVVIRLFSNLYNHAAQK